MSNVLFFYMSNVVLENNILRDVDEEEIEPSTEFSLTIPGKGKRGRLGRGLSETALYSWILWYLWVSRNKLIFENREMQELEVVSLALKEARIWQSAQQNKEKPSPSQKLQVPLACGTVRGSHCFVDAAWNAATRGGGFGCIFKENNKKLCQTSSNRCDVGSALVAEALAVKAGLKAARSLGLRKLTLWSDSKSLIMAINTKENIVEAQEVLFDISQLCTSFLSISFLHTPRVNNVEADALAKRALLELTHSV
ncbi:hypothetical protein F2Q68_00013278 [Brassica cretica]|uniref:RNase H type-1 domain-containing protein n=1 Tax=Brassica cretica TaxID=69181 RepID=A0A8S9HJG4_BRACR|nr:hypothetical protein F2Q68_00013278 [Brassica cretica]